MGGMGVVKKKKRKTLWSETTIYLPDNPPTSIFFRFFASKITTVNLPAVGTYRNEKQMSPNFSCWWAAKSSYLITIVFFLHNFPMSFFFFFKRQKVKKFRKKGNFEERRKREKEKKLVCVAIVSQSLRVEIIFCWCLCKHIFFTCNNFDGFFWLKNLANM